MPFKSKARGRLLIIPCRRISYTIMAVTTNTHMVTVATELNAKLWQIQGALKLLDDGATVPFISRYRKEATGNLDEVQILTVRDRITVLRELDKRREAILSSLTEQEVLTPELEKAVRAAETLSRLEDIYLPYRPKRRTRGTIAKERGLEPLAQLLFNQKCSDPAQEAAKYVDPEKEVPDTEAALAGARDIIAEWINEDTEARAQMRRFFKQSGRLISKVVKKKEEDAAKYRDYFSLEESASRAPSHRILAVFRGAQEGFLTLKVLPPEEEALELLKKRLVSGTGEASGQVALAAEDSYKRLMGPSLENELKAELKTYADEEAIRVFASNLRELLLAPPMGGRATLGVDPGLRTGCKIVCLNAQGDLLHNETIYPLPPKSDTAGSAKRINTLVKEYGIQAVAVGNGTGGREALSFIEGLGLQGVIVTLVNESGASVYSASKTAREEFPDQDLTVRGSVSIARRLMDPLAELVKIDPKSIGVGQYQHDVDQRQLKKSLDDVVSSCVNAVGVDVNTASKELLSYVSGLNSKTAKALVEYRNSNGAFGNRETVLKAPGLGTKSFEQCAGFLRIPGGKNPLDASAVHPERYVLVEQMARDLGASVDDLIKQQELRRKINLRNYISDDTGMPTLKDIMAELEKPGRDPREEFSVFSFAEGVETMEDLQTGMELPGVVTNVTNFGAFVDIGVHQDGLVHISQLADHFVHDPREEVKVNQKVKVRVVDVDISRKRIALSMKEPTA